MLDKQAWLVLLAALLIGFGSLTTSIILATDARTQTCEAVKSLATIQHEKVKEEKDEVGTFEEQSPDRLGLSPEQFANQVAKRRHGEEHRAERYTLIAHRAC